MSRQLINGFKSAFHAAGIALLISACAPLPSGDHPQVADVSAQTVATRAVDDLLAREEYMMYVSDQFNGIHYAEAAAGYGALKFARLSDNRVLTDRLLERYRQVPGTATLLDDDHVDANVYGILPLERYLTTGDPSALSEGLALADDQWQDPLANGMTRQTRYWIDDVWMIGALQIQAYRATGDIRYLDRAALEIDAYLQRLQQPNGLFHHGPEAPFFWGRGNGWVAAGLAELLAELPAGHPRFNAINAGYRKMMAALLRYQADDGMWRQLIDHPDAWKETSATAMFGFAITVGVQKGLLPKVPYQQAAEQAWVALTGYVNANGRLTDVCVGTGQSLDVNYYLQRPRTTGDLHGQAPLLWFAAARMQPQSAN